MKSLLVGLVASFISFTGEAERPSRAAVLFREGVAARNDQQKSQQLFRQAEKALNREYRFELRFSASGELALGNLRFLSGDLPGAISAYRYGLWRAPGDPALRWALRYARSQVSIPTDQA